jgi:hypothetical protein
LRTIRELRWRDDRVEHIARHDVVPAEVEAAVFYDREVLGGGVAMPVTARDMDAKERRRYSR